jgi:hypothetical protein
MNNVSWYSLYTLREVSKFITSPIHRGDNFDTAMQIDVMPNGKIFEDNVLSN